VRSKREKDRDEALLKDLLIKAFAKSPYTLEATRHEDKITSGIPDVSVTTLGRTVWLEVKHANPSFTSRGVQELKMKKLALTGLSAYVVYDEVAGKTFFFRPGLLRYDDGNLGLWRTSNCVQEFGLAHDFVVTETVEMAKRANIQTGHEYVKFQRTFRE
jgi:hypothetical protein